jgi:hypothetical protein
MSAQVIAEGEIPEPTRTAAATSELLVNHAQKRTGG